MWKFTYLVSYKQFFHLFLSGQGTIDTEDIAEITSCKSHSCQKFNQPLAKVNSMEAMPPKS